MLIANRIIPFIGAIFSIILISGVYTTAFPLLWLICNRLFVDEKSNRFRVGAIVLTLIAFFLSRFPFAVLVNVLCTIILLVFCIFKKRLSNREAYRDPK